jgi:LDH2 family malate/lactate/ureidoglycolate dehydrogenase
MSVFIISDEKLKKWGMDAFICAGASSSEAETVMDVLVHSNLRGVDTHGVIRLPYYVNRLTRLPHASPQVVRNSKTACVVDARFSPGPVGAAFAMEKAVEKAGSHGMGMAAVRHSNHCGTAAYYALMAVERGMLGISLTNASPRIAPWGSVEPLIGNNPWSIALPGVDFPIVLDMANTVVANGKIRTCLREGKQLQPGWAMDAAGNPTLDPHEAINGLLMPIGGYKGVGISVMVDLMTAALAQGAFSCDVGKVDDPSRHTDAAHLFMAVDIGQIISPIELKEKIGEYIASFKGVQLQDGVSEVFLPGEIEWRLERQRRRDGIPLSQKTVEELNTMAHSIGCDSVDS